MAKKYSEKELKSVCKRKYGVRSKLTSLIGAVSSTAGTLLSLGMIFGIISVGSLDIPTLSVAGSNAGITIGSTVMTFLVLMLFVLLTIFGIYTLVISERM